MVLSHKDLQELEHARRDAMLSADTAAMESHFSDELVWIHASSNVDDKKSFIKGFQEGTLACFKLEYTPTSIRNYEGVAVVTGVVHMEVAVHRVRRSQASRYTCIWAQEGERFRLTLCQATRFPSEPAV